MELFGVHLVGANAETAHKVLLTIGLVLAYVALRAILRLSLGILWKSDQKRTFWRHQFVNLATGAILLLGLLSIWFDNPKNLATGFGLVTAGLAFALQKVVTAIAAYFVILRGNTFKVGDRIVMGGVRGDVIALGFMQTTIMEMGQPPSVQSDAPAMWVGGRQFTGRIVKVSNAKIFDEPVYNYSKDFALIWEEIRIPITYTADREAAEAILLETAQFHTTPAQELGRSSVHELMKRFGMSPPSLNPEVFYRLTDNWLELSLRFVVDPHEARHIKDRMSRDILNKFEAKGLGIASSTFEIVGLPPLRLENEPQSTLDQFAAQTRTNDLRT